MTLATELRAVTRELDPTIDVMAALGPDCFAWLHDGLHLVTEGTALAIAPGDALDALRAIEVDDAVRLPGTGAVAVGALPFEAQGAATLAVPARVWGQEAGRAWVTEIGPPHAPQRVDTRTATRFSVASRQSREHWVTKVAGVLTAIEAGELEKAVLAREVIVESDSDFDIPALIRRLVVQQPGCFVYAAQGFVGASPELLVRRRGDRLESRPMAGTTVTNGGAGALAALAASVKDGHEHRLVVDAITRELATVCTELAVGEPEVAVFGTVAHLATPVRGRLDLPPADALSLARRLHPTPAVGGTPRAEALATIAALEGFTRGRYAGPVGWVDARGDGEWAVALRGAEIDGRRARLVVGVGIVAGSDPEAEWAETQAKLEPMLRALVRP